MSEQNSLHDLNQILVRYAGIILLIMLCAMYFMHKDVVMAREDILKTKASILSLADSIDRTEMFGIKIDEFTKLQGVYKNYDKFYCVWAENRTIEDITKTEVHEMCHHHINIDYEHFCR